jgi:hypothetical protein
MDDAPKYLYKYVGFEGAIDVLTKLRLKFTRVTDVNDPHDINNVFQFEFTDNEFADAYIREELRKIYSDEEPPIVFTGDPETDDLRKLRAEKRNKYREMRNILSPNIFEDEREIIINDSKNHKKELEEIWIQERKHIYILCLTESYNNLEMWQNYTNLHTGGVIRFKSMREKNIISYARKVEYNDKPIFVACLDDWVKSINYELEINMREHFNKCAFRKNTKWEYEHEWRCIKERPPNKTAHCIYLKIHPEEIDSVYLGNSMNEENRQKIIDVAKKRNINIFQARLIDNSTEMKFTPLNT